MDTLITRVRLLDPASGRDALGSLLIRDGRIADLGAGLGSGLGSGLGRPDGADVIDGGGAILCPGLVDMRAESPDPALDAAACHAGGITTIACLPPVDEPALVRLRQTRGAAAGLSALPYAAATAGCAGAALAEYGLLRDAGAVAFTDGARAIASARLMRAALLYARGFGARIVQHPEDPSLAAGGAATEGERATRMGLPGIPPEAEAILVARDIALARLTGGAVHFAHVSTAAALAAIRRAKDEHLAVTCDTAPPYFDLNETAIGDYRTYAKLSPPLRTEADRLAVLAALADGTVDAIASDHQPRDADDKRVPFVQAAPGGAGFATLLGITLAQVHAGGLTLSRAIELLTARPAGLLQAEGGTMMPGAPADLLLFDPDRAWRVAAGHLPGRAQNTPFDGRALEGRVIGTWQAGRRVFAASQS